MSYVEKSVLRPSLGPKNLPKGLYVMILTAVSWCHVLLRCLTGLTG